MSPGGKVTPQQRKLFMKRKQQTRFLACYWPGLVRFAFTMNTPLRLYKGTDSAHGPFSVLGQDLNPDCLSAYTYANLLPST